VVEDGGGVVAVVALFPRAPPGCAVAGPGEAELARLAVADVARRRNAIVAFRYDTSELGTTWTEVCAYGTAVRARQL
jgi:hypothetical protein